MLSVMKVALVWARVTQWVSAILGILILFDDDNKDDDSSGKGSGSN